MPLNQEQRLPISDLLGNYALSLIDAKNFRLTVAHNAGSADRRIFKALLVALRWTTTFLHVYTNQIAGK